MSAQLNPWQLIRGPERLVMLLTAVTVVAGCQDHAPTPQFTYNLGTENARLLPSSGIYQPAYDGTILSGNTQATIVRFDEFDAAAAEPARPADPAASVTPVELGEAASIGGAFRNVGTALLANIVAGNQGDAGGSTPGAVPAPAPAATGSTSADQQAIDGWLAAYNAAWTQRNLAVLPSLLVDRQQSMAEDYFDLLDELNGSLTAFLPLYKQLDARAVDDATGKTQQAFAAVALIDVSITGSGQAQATLRRGDGVDKSVTLEQENGTWRLVHPEVPDASQWPSLQNQIQTVIDDLDDGVLDMDGGSANAAQLGGVLARALANLLPA